MVFSVRVHACVAWRVREREASVPLCSLGLFHKVLKTGLSYHTHGALLSSFLAKHGESLIIF